LWNSSVPHRAPTTSSRTAERRSPTRRIQALPTFLARRGLRGPVARAALRVGARVVQDPLGHTLARHLVGTRSPESTIARRRWR
jgi:hypothetical protein